MHLIAATHKQHSSNPLTPVHTPMRTAVHHTKHPHAPSSLAHASVFGPCINTSLLKAPRPQGEGIAVGADLSLPR